MWRSQVNINTLKPMEQDEEILSDVKDLAVSLSPFVNNLPELRKEYREARKGPEVQMRDDKRLYVLDKFVETLESDELKDSMVSTLQSILAVEGV